MKKKSQIYFSTAIVNYINLLLGVLSGIISARLLGPEGRGELAVILYFPALMAPFCCLGLPQAIPFTLLKRKEKAKEIAAAAFRLSLFLGLAGAVIFSVIAPFYLSEKNQHLINPVIWICFLAIPMIINPNLYAIHRGHYRFSWINGMLVLVAGGYVLILISLWWLDILQPFYISLCLMALHTMVLMANVIRNGVDLIWIRVDWPIYKTCLAQGVRFFFPVMAVTMYNLSDRAILIKTVTVAELGYYAVAMAITQPLALLSTTFYQIGFVEIASKCNSDESALLAWRRFQQVQVIMAGMILFMLPLVKPLLLFGFGKEFVGITHATMVLVCAMGIRGLSVTIENNLRAQNYIWPGILSALISLLVLVGLSFFLVPRYGILGFSMGLLISELTGFMGIAIILRKKFGVEWLDLWGVKKEIIVSLVLNIRKMIKKSEEQTCES